MNKAEEKSEHWQDGSEGKSASAKTDDLSQIPEHLWWEESTDFFKLSSDLHMGTGAPVCRAHVPYRNKINGIIIIFFYLFKAKAEEKLNEEAAVAAAGLF